MYLPLRDLMIKSLTQQKLPTSICAWSGINLDEEEGPWEFLRPYFHEAGYDLFAKVHCGCEPRLLIPPAVESFGLYGDRTNELIRFPLWASLTFLKCHVLILTTVTFCVFRHQKYMLPVMRECIYSTSLHPSIHLSKKKLGEIGMSLLSWLALMGMGQKNLIFLDYSTLNHFGATQITQPPL